MRFRLIPPTLRRYALFLALGVGIGFQSLPAQTACLPPLSALIRSPQSAAHQKRGPHLWLSATEPTRKFEEISQLKLLSWNMLNLYYHQGDWRKGAPLGQFVKKAREPKSDAFLKQMAEMFLKSDPDLAVLVEIEGEESLKSFASEYLNNQYRPILIHGNDERIDIGFLVKKDLPFDIEVQSHRDVKRSGDPNPVFSRDLPLLSFRKAGSSPDSKPLFLLLGVHYKSQRDSEGDPRSVKLRAAQVEESLKLIEDYQKRWGGNLPVMFSGDFNSDLRTASELSTFREQGFQDAFDLGKNPLPKEARTTHTYHPKEGPKVWSQLDGILVSKGSEAIVKEAKIIRYHDPSGEVIPIPETFDQRKQQPSDHFPIEAVLDFRKIRQLSEAPARTETKSAAQVASPLSEGTRRSSSPP